MKPIRVRGSTLRLVGSHLTYEQYVLMYSKLVHFTLPNILTIAFCFRVGLKPVSTLSLVGSRLARKYQTRVEMLHNVERTNLLRQKDLIHRLMGSE
jgi:hypothetical protein